MRIVPAVDIRGGLCVNLVQGDYAQETVFSKDPVAQAIQWHELSGGLVHIVDLDGARQGEVCAEEALRAMARAGVPFEVGGGIRSLAMLKSVFDAGAERAILGTAAHEDPAFLREAVDAYPGKIVVGIDAKAGKVALDAWVSVTDTDAVEFGRHMEQAGAARIIYTDILSDGMMHGPNLDATRRLAQALSIPVTVSGGISSLDDIRDARGLEPDGVDEVIVGRALYLERFALPEAVTVAQGAP